MRENTTMKSYFAYHGPENLSSFDHNDGYGFKDTHKISKVNIGDILYVIQKIKDNEYFELCGAFHIREMYLDKNHPSGRIHRLRLSKIKDIVRPIVIDEDLWSDSLPDYSSKHNWSNFKKHFCREGATLEAPLSKDVLLVINSFLDDYDPINYNLSNDVMGIINDKDLSSSEKDSFVKSRVGQGKFKSNVKKVWGFEHCAVTLCPVSEILIASHIKPWSECEKVDERLDGANGLLLCAHIDKLFDSHLVTFKPRNKDYELVISNLISKNNLKGLGIESGSSLNLLNLTSYDMDRFKVYMAHHNSKFDEKNSVA